MGLRAHVDAQYRSTARELQASVGQSKRHKPCPFIGWAFGKRLPDPPGRDFIFGEEQQITTAAGAEQLGGGHIVLNAIQDPLDFGRIRARVKLLI